MKFEAGNYRCKVTERNSVFIGEVFNQDGLVCTLTADSLPELRKLFAEWIAGEV